MSTPGSTSTKADVLHALKVLATGAAILIGGYKTNMWIAERDGHKVPNASRDNLEGITAVYGGDQKYTGSAPMRDRASWGDKPQLYFDVTLDRVEGEDGPVEIDATVKASGNPNDGLASLVGGRLVGYELDYPGLFTGGCDGRLRAGFMNDGVSLVKKYTGIKLPGINEVCTPYQDKFVESVLRSAELK